MDRQITGNPSGEPVQMAKRRRLNDLDNSRVLELSGNVFTWSGEEKEKKKIPCALLYGPVLRELNKMYGFF